MGLACRVGSVNGQRVALITDLVRADLSTASEASLRTDLLRRVAQTLAENEMPVLDAGFKIRELQAAKLSRYTVRLAVNFTARRNRLPPSEGGRPCEYGDVVRPLARVRNGKLIAATPPDRVETWREDGLQFRAEFWDNLVLPMLRCAQRTPPSVSSRCTTRAFGSRGSWLARSVSRGLPCAASTATAGRWNKYPWPPSKCWGVHANSSSPQRVVNACPS